MIFIPAARVSVSLSSLPNMSYQSIVDVGSVDVGIIGIGSVDVGITGIGSVHVECTEARFPQCGPKVGGVHMNIVVDFEDKPRLGAVGGAQPLE